MNLYDIHTHLQSFSQINGYDIKYILNTYPFKFEEMKKEQPSAQYFSCGIHPWYAEDYENQYDRLKEIVYNHDEVVAIGEAGFDKIRGMDMNIQAEIFKFQVQLAEEVRKPVIIHCVKAWDELIAVKKEINPKQPWIIHGYRGNAEQTEQLNKLDFRFSIGGLYNAEAVKNIPLSSLFIETDTADVSVFTIYHKISRLLHLSMVDLVGIINKNVASAFIL